MLRFFGKSDQALKHMVNNIWLKALSLAPNTDSGIDGRKAKQCRADLVKLIPQYASWMIDVHKGDDSDSREMMYTFAAKEILLYQENKTIDCELYYFYPSYNLVDLKTRLQEFSKDLVIYFKADNCGLVEKPQAGKNKAMQPTAAAKKEENIKFDPFVTLRADIICEIQERQEKMLREKLLKNGKQELANEVKSISWCNQELYRNNLVACLSDEVLSKVLNNQDEEAEEEFQGKVIDRLIEGIMEHGGIILSERKGAAEASLPKELFKSKEKLAALLKPVLDKYAPLEVNSAKAKESAELAERKQPSPLG